MGTCCFLERRSFRFLAAVVRYDLGMAHEVVSVIGLGDVSKLLLVAAFLSALVTPAAHQPKSADWQLVVLGIAQDAGIPHLNCQQPLCASIRAGKRRAERVSSLGLVDRVERRAPICSMPRRTSTRRSMR